MPTIIEYDTPAQKIALAVVTQWIGGLDPPPKIDSEQSEVLQVLIVRALIGQTMSPPGFAQGKTAPLCPYCFGVGKIVAE